MTPAPSVSTHRILVWQALVLLLLLVLPTTILGRFLFELPKREIALYSTLYVAYIAGAIAHLVYVRHLRGWRSLLASAVVTAAPFAFALFVILATRITISHQVVLRTFALALVLLPLSLWPRVSLQASRVLFAGLLVLGAFITREQSIARGTHGKEATTTTFASAYYPLEIKTFRGYLPQPAVRGGGLTLLGNEVLLGTGDGYFYRLKVAGDGLEAVKLPLRAPVNSEAFAAAVGVTYAEPSMTWAKVPVKVQSWRFRMADILVQPAGDHARLYASHHYWYNDKQCYAVRISTIDLPLPLPAKLPEDWQTFYESEPCLPLSGPLIDRNPHKQFFAGEEIGGRMEFLDDHTLLVTVGSHALDGLSSSYMVAQDPTASYGKTIAIDLPTKQARIYSLGHRDAQGLLVDRQGRVWETEHGPRGGDELNIIKAGANYGWPRVTYGTEYAQFVWTLTSQQGRHDNYEKPLYSWVPSIGVSNLISVTKNRFPAWQGDLLVSSLVGRSLYRVRVEDERVVLTEAIPVEQRVRDLLELPDGRLFIWADGGVLMSIAPAADTGPKLAFGVACGGCHAITDDMARHPGPDLLGVVGSDIASSRFSAYSPALSSKPGVWSRANLDEFLRNPQAFVPGTTMMFPGIDEPSQRQALIDYLASQGDRPPQ
jgi:cytochrome c2